MRRPDNSRTLLNLRRRHGRIRVFDPACGSSNFLVRGRTPGKRNHLVRVQLPADRQSTPQPEASVCSMSHNAHWR